MGISFHDLDNVLSSFNRRGTAGWIRRVIEFEGKVCGDISVVFCSDDYLLEMNRKYLQHDTYTDIITFDYSEGTDTISGDLFISIDRVKENALAIGVLFDEELFRVVVHGVLHLLGYRDKEREEKHLMQQKEDYYLTMRPG